MIARLRPLPRLLVAVGVAAVLFRVSFYFSGLVAIVYDTYDSWEYRDLGRSLLEQGVFGLHGIPKMNRTPGYPAFLAVVFATLGSGQLAVSTAQVTLDALACVMVTHIAAIWRLQRAAVVSVGVLAATCMYTSAYSMMMMTEAPYAFCIVLGLWALATAPVADLPFGRSGWRIALSAVSLGAGVLIRPALAVPVALFGVAVACRWLITQRRRSLTPRAMRQLAVYAAVLTVIVGGWMTRNYVVFHAEFVKPEHPDVTLLGYKTDIPTYRHWYSPQMRAYLSSYEEPFVMTSPYRAPVTARYVYPGEREDVERAFARLGREILANGDPIPRETLDLFAVIAAKRHAAAPRLAFTAPVSRMLKFWIAPRISAFWQDTSGHNSSLALTAGWTAYDALYVLPAVFGLGMLAWHSAVGVEWLYIAAMIVGHTWMYGVWMPGPQSRYAIPLFPLVSLLAGVAIDVIVGRWRSRATSIVSA